MKRIAFACICLTVFSGCQKLLDHYNYPTGHNSSGCKITLIAYNSDSFVDSTRISYNAAGQPVSVQYDSYDVQFGNNFNTYTFHYTYDNTGRLTSETSDWVYSQDQVFYAYEGASKKPVRDTIPKIFGQVVVEDFGYDLSGRLIKVVRRTVEQWPTDPEVYPTEEYNYFYDEDGNRQEDPSNINYPGVIEYSDKPSLYSLHPTWQIVHKDYSRNSVLYADGYNDKGLPVSISTEAVTYFQPFLSMYPGSKISYECN